jgi:predicted ATPase
VVIFEEPENYIHPNLMERLVAMLKAASAQRQIVISTHSVPLLNLLALEDLRIVERDKEGGTTIRSIKAREELKAALKDWALGEAYVSGVLDEA